MTKRELPKHVYSKSNGLYFQRRGTPSHRFSAAFGTPEFFAEYAFVLRGKPALPPSATFAGLVTAYKGSADYTRLAARTRRDYAKVLDYIVSKYGTLPFAKMQTKDVLRAQAANPGRFGDYIVQVFRILFAYAKRQGWMDGNPAQGLRMTRAKPKPEDAREPWPQEAKDAFREAFPVGARERLLFELMLGAGQRIGDTLQLRWNAIRDGGIELRQSKTGKLLWVPLTRHLTAALAATPKTGLTIVAQENGRPVAYNTAQKWMRAARVKVGAERWDQHALRYSAVDELSEAGCTDEQIMSVTGHSTLDMVRLYAGRARQRRHAAQVKELRE